MNFIVNRLKNTGIRNRKLKRGKSLFMQNKASSVNFIFKYDPGEEKNQVTSGITGNGVYRSIYMMKVMFWFIN